MPQAKAILILAALFPFVGAAAASREVAAAVIILEAGGEGRQGMEAVAEVIQQRARERRQTSERVVLAAGQFSCMNARTPQQAVRAARNHPRWKDALTMAQGVQTHHTRGANHYCTLSTFPKWARNTNPVAVVGQHKFFKL